MDKSEVLLMFSGGLDSTGVFYKLLKENKKIHAHHLHLDNKENRYKAEGIAVKNIYEYVNYPPAEASGLVNHRSNLHNVYYKPIDAWLVLQQLAVEEAFVCFVFVKVDCFYRALRLFSCGKCQHQPTLI